MASTARRWLLRAAIAYAVYLALVMLLVMPAANMLLPRIYQEQTGRELHFDALLLNPVTLSARLVRAADTNPDGSRFWAFDELLLDVGLWRSLRARHPVLDELHLLGLSLEVWRDGERFNFSDILEHRAALDGAPKDDTADADLPALTVRRLVFSAEHLGYAERDREEPFETFVQALSFQLWGLTTHVDNGHPYRLEARDEAGGGLSWQGRLSLAGRHSSGRIAVDNISLLPAWRYLAPRLHLVVENALLDVDMRYRLDWSGDTPTLDIDDGRLRLRDLRLHGRDDDTTRIDWEALVFEGIALDSAAQQVQVARIGLNGLDLAGHSDGADISLLPLLQFETDAAAADAATDANADTPPWQLHVAEIALDDSRLRWRAAELATALEIAPRLTLRNLHWPQPEPATLELALDINQDSQISVSGNLVPVQQDLALEGAIARLPLPWFQPLLQRHLRAQLTSGLLDAQWQLAVTAGAPQTAAAEITLDDLRLLDNGSTLLGWERMRLQGLDVNLATQRASIDHIHLRAPEARFAIHAEGGNNIADLLVDTDEPGDDVNDSGNSDDDTAPWQFGLARVQVEQGRLDFSDDSLALPFRAFIQGLEGSIEGLDTATGEHARVDLSGNVDGYAPVALLGSVQPLASPPELDLSFNFSHIDLATLTPYSGTYAGYAIDRGLLTVNLDYHLEAGRIRGQNRVIIDQLRLGERINSPRALELPLRLAIALLTDSRGVMDLGVEVSGDIDDPNFHLGQVIWTAFRNLIVRTATAPLRFLAGLVGSDRDLDRVEFEAGSSALTAEAGAILENLVEALQQRPNLRLTLAGHYDRERDLEALAARQLTQRLREAGLDDDHLQRRDARWERGLARLYRELLPEGEAEEAEAREAELLTHLAPDASELPRLAAERAMAIKQALVSRYDLPGDRALVERDQVPPGGNAAVLIGVDAL